MNFFILFENNNFLRSFGGISLPFLIHHYLCLLSNLFLIWVFFKSFFSPCNIKSLLQFTKKIRNFHQLNFLILFFLVFDRKMNFLSEIFHLKSKIFLRKYSNGLLPKTENYRKINQSLVWFIAEDFLNSFSPVLRKFFPHSQSLKIF